MYVTFAGSRTHDITIFETTPNRLLPSSGFLKCIAALPQTDGQAATAAVGECTWYFVCTGTYCVSVFREFCKALLGNVDFSANTSGLPSTGQGALRCVEGCCCSNG